MFKNVSKFRSANSKQLKEVYLDIKVSSPSATSNYATASSLYVAVPHGTGAFGNVAILPLDFSKFNRRPDPLVISAHSEQLTDLLFNPFNPSMLATACKDSAIKLFTIPEGGLTSNLSEPTARIGEFEGGVNSLGFHRSAGNILAVGSKSALSVVDLEKGAIAYSFKVAGNGKDVLSSDWSYDGNLLSGVGKDGMLHVFDPRSAAENVLSSSLQLEMKAQRSFFLGKDHSLVVLGHSKTRNPQLAIYDSRDMSKTLLSTTLDCSVGVFLSAYDIDTQLMFLAVRGSGSMAIYDMSETGKATKTSVLQGASLFQATTLIPKAACDLQSCEVQRVMKATQEAVEQHTITIPRKIVGFHEDVYPDTLSPEPALSAQDWLGGANSAPNLVNILKVASLKGGPAATAATPEPTAAARSGSVPSASEVKQQAADHSRATSFDPRAVMPATEQKLASFLEKKSETRKAIEDVLKKGTFTNVGAVEPQSMAAYYFDVPVDQNMTLNRNIKVNAAYWAVAYKTLGGSAIHLNPLEKFGRVAVTNPPLVRGHSSQVSVFDLSPLNPNILASGAGDCKLKVFQIPAGGLTTDLNEAAAEFSCNGRIVTCDFHPSVENVVAASSTGFDGTFLKLYDLTANKEAISFDCHKDGLFDVAFAVDCSLIASTSKDKQTRLLDHRSGKETAAFEPFESGRDTRVFWAGKGGDLSKRLVTLGFGKMSKRSVSYYDLRNLTQPVRQLEIDMTNSSLMPHYDEDTRLLVVGSSGTRLIRLFQISDDTGLEFLSTFTSCGDITGLAFRPKSVCDFRNSVEIMSGLTVCKGDSVMPISYRVPRKRIEFFQDDIFPPTRVYEPVMSTSDYFGGAAPVDPRYESLKPADMTPLSEAPPEQLSERQLKYAAGVAAKEAPKVKGVLGHETADEVRQHFMARAADRPLRSNRWDAQRDDTYQEVADDEWN